MSKRWYVLHAKSCAEKKLIDKIRERLEETNQEELVGDILVPTEEVVELRGGEKRKSERKFFPGYLLINMEMSDEIWHTIRRTPGVLGFLGGSKPAPIPDSQAMNILKQLEEDASQPKPKVLFEPGEVIRVTEGPFADFNGVVEEVNYEKNRLRVAVLIFGRSTPVELEFSQVEKA